MWITSVYRTPQPPCSIQKRCRERSHILIIFPFIPFITLSMFLYSVSDSIERAALYRSLAMTLFVIAVTHLQAADVWEGMWPPHLRQLLKRRFGSSNSAYNNAISKLTEKQLTFYRKALKDLSKALVEAVNELGKERAR